MQFYTPTMHLRILYHPLYSGNLNKRFQCPLCQKKFVRKEERKEHLRRDHPGMKSFLCPHPNCGATFTKRSHFKDHERTHRSGNTEVSVQIIDNLKLTNFLHLTCSFVSDFTKQKRNSKFNLHPSFFPALRMRHLPRNFLPVKASTPPLNSSPQSVPRRRRRLPPLPRDVRQLQGAQTPLQKRPRWQQFAA